MLGNLLIGLREGLEASLVVSILVAYLVKTERRHLLPRLWLGVGAAVAISLGVGAILTFGPSGLEEETQELIGGVLSVLAVGLVTWMILWMATAGRTLAGDLRARIDGAAESRWALPLVALLAVGREGLETALFLWAATTSAAAESGSAMGPLLGAVIGIAIAVAIGWAIYAGALRINLSQFFAWTGGFLIIVAAGVLAYGVHELQEAGALPGEDLVAYDVSHVIAPGSVLGTLLRGIFNFRPAPSVGEVIAWVVYVAVVTPLFIGRLRASRRPAAARPQKSEPVKAAS